MSVGGCILIYLAIYGPEIIGGLWSVRPRKIDPRKVLKEGEVVFFCSVFVIVFIFFSCKFISHVLLFLLIVSFIFHPFSSQCDVYLFS